MVSDCTVMFASCSESDPRRRGRSGLGGGFESEAITGFFRVTSTELSTGGSVVLGFGCACAASCCAFSFLVFS